MSREAPKSMLYFIYLCNIIAALGIGLIFWTRMLRQSSLVIPGFFLLIMGLMGLAYCYYWAQREMQRKRKEEKEEEQDVA